MIFLIWQVATKVAAVPSCVQVQSHDTIFHSIFPCDMLSAKIIWCEHKIRIKQSFQNRLAFYFHRQSDENRIMRTVKEIRSDFNWSIDLVHILMFICSLIKSVLSFWFISYFPHCSVSAFATLQKNAKKNIIFYVFCNKYSVELMAWRRHLSIF